MSSSESQQQQRPCSPKPETGKICHPAAGAALVLQYIDERVAESTSDPLRDLQDRIEQLERKLSALANYNEQLEDAVRQAQLGFRRHRSERIDPNQLHMALTVSEHPATGDQQTGACENTTTAKTAEPADAQSCESESDDSTPPDKPKRKSKAHGRRKVGVIPRIIVQVLPPEVLVEGLEAFEQIGHEDASLIGHRRGGPLELVVRRPKFVRRDQRSSKPTDAESDTPSGAAGGRASLHPCATHVPCSDVANQPSVSTGSAQILEHQFLTVPQEPTCRHNPFVDGAIVRYYPPSADCEPGSSKVLIAPPPERPISKGLADASLLAHLFVDKQGRHLPYYRQEAELERFGWPISRGTMARWQFECGQLVRPLVDAMWQQSLQRSWFAMDATGTAIRGSPEHKLGHVFVLVAEGQSIVFRYSSTHDGATIEKLFGGYCATIVADASSCHNGLFGPGKNTEAGCWAHARRRFVSAFRGAEGAEPAAVLQTMQALFRIEREIADLDPAKRLEVRKRKSAPLVDALLGLAARRRTELTDPDSFTRKGFVYLHNQSGPLREFLINGELPMHNNVSERELRRHVKGRMAWLFHGSEEHARSACAISSLVASAELLGMDPELYLQELLTVLPSYPVNRVLELSPERWLDTRERLIAEGRLKYLDLAQVSGSALSFRPR